MCLEVDMFRNEICRKGRNKGSSNPDSELVLCKDGSSMGLEPILELTQWHFKALEPRSNHVAGNCLDSNPYSNMHRDFITIFFYFSFIVSPVH